MDIGNNYLESIKKQFNQYKSLGEKAMNQLEKDELLFVNKGDSNSIAVIVKHMHGNMLSRWTDFLTTDGEKTWRERDDEFEQGNINKETVFRLWAGGWACFFDAINSLDAGQLSATIYIRKEAHTVMEAIHRQLAHYSYHVGQIVFAAKQLKGEDWNSLSIPKKKAG